MKEPTGEPSTIETITTIKTIGLDIAKTSFAVHGFDDEGHSVVAKALKRGQVLAFFAGLEPTRVGLETCASAHYCGRELMKLGVTVTGLR